ncbi:hypothetical protein HYH03_000300 [Edaphochlamys debaryana]|uniref:EF-hand domain-containing protein n=1 Tax=Edaphochlamys debaryana TaxID=47281 RepID=A0A835YNP5_9CHLO|nr:hypothetical protein HYH03_000300 [Edaphochlamys debaryana]|eukprot:KAG2501800.1 hypothetical protein HYH03_000300 [Edaphochlamys debaryana]
MPRLPNPFRRGSRSGRSTAASSAVGSEASTPAGARSPRTLSSHGLNIGDEDISTHAGGGGGGGAGNGGVIASGGLGGTPVGGGGTPGKGVGGTLAAAAGDAREAAAAAAGSVKAAVSGAVGAVGGGAQKLAAAVTGSSGAESGKTGSADLKYGTGKPLDSAMDMNLDLGSGATWRVGLDPARFTDPSQDGPSASLLMPPGVSGGGLAAPAPPLVIASIPAAPITLQRPVPTNLPDYMDNPGESYREATPDRFHPKGGPLTPSPGGPTSLQQHFAYFDINKDGVITLPECITAFAYLLRRLLPPPLNWAAAVPAALAVQLPMAWLTADSWLPDPLLRAQVKNAHKVVHGSNSRAWDRSGHFTPARFEALLSKYDRDGKGGLSLLDVLSMLRGQANLGDLLGMAASTGEWLMTWALLRDDTGVLRREDMRGMYDGTAFYRLAERNGYKHYGLESARRPAVEKGYA